MSEPDVLLIWRAWRQSWKDWRLCHTATGRCGRLEDAPGLLKGACGMSKANEVPVDRYNLSGPDSTERKLEDPPGPSGVHLRKNGQPLIVIELNTEISQGSLPAVGAVKGQRSEALRAFQRTNFDLIAGGRVSANAPATASASRLLFFSLHPTPLRIQDPWRWSTGRGLPRRPWRRTAIELQEQEQERKLLVACWWRTSTEERLRFFSALLSNRTPGRLPASAFAGFRRGSLYPVLRL
ncbi:hypothetical protein DFH06DRAFT_1443928 [Mycena polygramma]|nr:hypothetical protein DFH06DRAFT_1443928 [Mycena polygramma]